MTITKINTNKLTALTEKQKAEIAAVSAMRDDEIDMSDSPSLPDAIWADARRGQFYKPLKSSTTLRVDADVLAWLKSEGKGYQTRINAILRDAMLNTVNADASPKTKSR